MTALWVHPFNGVAGDMMLGALVDLGADIESIRSQLQSLDVDGWSINVETILRNGISATNLTVSTNEGHSHRTAGDIAALVDGSTLSERVRRDANAVFTALAEAEAQVHATEPSSVHFHEVGGIDAIVDVVGTCVALELLDVDTMVVGPISVGHGITKSAHGRIPHPAPATALLLEGIPVRSIDTNVELTTPTGAAICRALADSFGPAPEMTVRASGFGAGDAKLVDHPNLLQMILGDGDGWDGQADQLLVLETNVDDLSGEYLAHAVEQLLAAGALDAWVTPISMKNNRPAATVSALIEPTDVVRTGEVLLNETGSLGFRTYGVNRRSVERNFGQVEVDGQRIAIKTSNETVKAEYRDVAAAATALGRPARLIAAEAEEQWRSSVDDNG